MLFRSSHAESSIPALEAALDALRPGGVLSAILYSGRVIYEFYGLPDVNN